MMAAVRRLLGLAPERARDEAAEEADQILVDVRDLLDGIKAQTRQIERRRYPHGGQARNHRA